jgi:ParB-like chromosome segregation protein Spo0J
MKIEFIDIYELDLSDKNPRKITKDQFKKLCNSIENDPDFFSARPCLVNESNGKKVIFAGNQRYRAAKELSWDTVPCIIFKDLDEETMKKWVLIDNLHHGEHDYDMLAAHYEIDDLLDLGFLEKELHIEFDNPYEKPKKEKKKKASTCPSCGHCY